MCTTCSGLPIVSSSGRTRSSAVASPPTMMDSDALMAPISPPLTGASSISAPRALASAAISRAVAGAMVLMSTMTMPGRSWSNTPCGPASTCRTSGESGTIVITTSVRAATSAGVAASVAPAWTSASTGARLRLCTTSEKPPLMRLSAMGRPMRPRPMNPTRSGISFLHKRKGASVPQIDRSPVRVEVERVGALLLRSEARVLRAAERKLVLDPGTGQIHRDQAGFDLVHEIEHP